MLSIERLPSLGNRFMISRKIALATVLVCANNARTKRTPVPSEASPRHQYNTGERSTQRWQVAVAPRCYDTSSRGYVIAVTTDDSLLVEYTTVQELIDFITYAIESISLEFDRWDDEYVRGPGLYFVVVTGVHSGQYADSLGDNHWPTADCRVVTDDLDTFVSAARTVGQTNDGAVIISTDGTIQKQMVRIKSQSDGDATGQKEHIEYADWMGTKHLSAIEVSVREEVLATITLSEENGRMSLFIDGDYEDYLRDELGGAWRSSD